LCNDQKLLFDFQSMKLEWFWWKFS
jgi:hypothetical protein